MGLGNKIPLKGVVGDFSNLQTIQISEKVGLSLSPSPPPRYTVQ